jgi:hypothetical protein
MAGCPFLVDAVMAFKLPFCDPASRLKRDPRQFVRRRSQKVWHLLSNGGSNKCDAISRRQASAPTAFGEASPSGLKLPLLANSRPCAMMEPPGQAGLFADILFLRICFLEWRAA